MKRSSIFALGICLMLLFGSASGRGDDKIADDLEKAKTKFKADVEKLRADIQDDFDKRIKAAQKKPQVEKIKDEQKVFEMHRILTVNADKDLKKRVREQGKAIETAFLKAKKAYDMAKKVAMSAGVEKEWKQLQIDGLITIAERPDLWIQLFNGMDLAGWEPVGNPVVQWRVDEKAIRGENKEKNGEGIWINSRQRDFDDFHLRMEVLCSPNSFAEVLIRNSLGVGGFYSMYLRSGKRETGSVVKWNKAIGDRILRNAEGPSPQEKEWFTIEFVTRGFSITTVVNGEKKVEVVDEDKVSAKGAFSIGLHEKDSILRIRKIEILPLSSPEKK
jgi:hypothetical protein